MRVTPPDIARLALSILIASLCVNCDMLHPAGQPPTMTAAPTIPATVFPNVSSTLLATATPDFRPEAATANAIARLTPYATPSLAGFTLTMDAIPPDGPAPLTVTFRARATGPRSPGCLSQLWDFGDGDGSWFQVVCAGPLPLVTPTPTPTMPVTTEYTITHTYRQPGTYRATFCPAQGAMCLLSATTTVTVR